MWVAFNKLYQDLSVGTSIDNYITMYIVNMILCQGLLKRGQLLGFKCRLLPNTRRICITYKIILAKIKDLFYVIEIQHFEDDQLTLLAQGFNDP